MLTSSTHLLLRRFQLSDIDDFLIYRQNPEVCRYQGFSPYTRDKAVAFIQDMVSQPLDAPGEWVQIAIHSIPLNRLIGDCALRFRADEPRIAEIGITMNPEFQGKGQARQAIELLLEFLVHTYDLHKAVAHLDARNESARNLLVRLGFLQEGCLRQNFFDQESAAWIDELVYGKIGLAAT